jgi:antitoxin ParD1/3/4
VRDAIRRTREEDERLAALRAVGDERLERGGHGLHAGTVARITDKARANAPKGKK